MTSFKFKPLFISWLMVILTPIFLRGQDSIAPNQPVIKDAGLVMVKQVEESDKVKWFLLDKKANKTLNVYGCQGKVIFQTNDGKTIKQALKVYSDRNFWIKRQSMPGSYVTMKIKFSLSGDYLPEKLEEEKIAVTYRPEE